jgi:hypothetical protein
MTEYNVLLDDIFSKLVKKYNKIQLSEYNINTIHSSNELIKEGLLILKTIKSHCTTLETLLSDCSDFVKELTNINDTNYNPNSIYVQKIKNNILLFPGKSHINNIIDTYEINKKKVKPSKQKQSIIEERILIPELNYKMKISSISNLDDIPPAFYFHAPTAGIYIKLPNNNIFRVPFPEIADSRKDYSRRQSIRCKYKTKDECDEQRSKMATMYNSSVRVCNFAHKGDKLVKIGYQSRCPSIPNFGNLETITDDIKLINDGDVKSMLLYGINDIFLSALWLDYIQLKNKTVHNLCVV